MPRDLRRSAQVPIICVPACQKHGQPLACQFDVFFYLVSLPLYIMGSISDWFTHLIGLMAESAYSRSIHCSLSLSLSLSGPQCFMPVHPTLEGCVPRLGDGKVTTSI